MQLHTLTIDGQPVAYRQSTGSGPAVLLIHGNSSSSRAYERQLEGPLGRTHRLVALDLPGFGDSQPVSDPDAVLGLQGWAQIVAQACAAIGLADAVLVGWSLGGHVALEALSALPQCKGVLIFGTPPIAFPPDMAAAFLPNPAMGAGFNPTPNDDEMRAYVQAFFAPDVQDIPSFFVEDMRRADGRARAAVAGSIRPGGYQDEVEIVRDLRLPLAVLQGESEQLVSLDYLRNLAMPTLWRGQVQVIPGAGHAPQWEQPELFNALLAAFVNDCEQGDDNMKFGVTAATGQLGRLVVQDLLQSQQAANIVAIVRDGAKAADLAAQGVDVRIAAYDDRAALEQALAGVDRLLLISGSEVGRRVQQHRNVIDAAKAVGVRHVVYTSAPRATTTSLVLAPEHKATEEYLVASGLDYTILRNNWYHENYSQQVATARQTGSVTAAAGTGRVASAARADYAAAAAAVLTGSGHAGKVYELGGDVAWDYNELAAAIAEVIDQPVTYNAVDGATLVNILQSVGLDAGTAQFVAALDANTAEGCLAETTGDLSRLIGRPTTPLVEGLRGA